MKLMHIFFDISMSNGHNGLEKILSRKKVSRDEYVVFINKNWTALKMITPGDVVLHLKCKHRIEPKAIKYLPHCVNGSDLDYPQALEQALLKDYGKKFKFEEKK